MALLDLQGLEPADASGKPGGGGKDHSGISALLCGGDDSSISLVVC
jgi:hypothetical protein